MRPFRLPRRSSQISGLQKMPPSPPKKELSSDPEKNRLSFCVFFLGNVLCVFLSGGDFANLQGKRSAFRLPFRLYYCGAGELTPPPLTQGVS